MICPKCGGVLEELYEDFYGRALYYCDWCDEDFDETDVREDDKNMNDEKLREMLEDYEKKIRYVYRAGFSDGFNEGMRSAADDLIEELRKRYPVYKKNPEVVDSDTANINLFDANDKAYRE